MDGIGWVTIFSVCRGSGFMSAVSWGSFTMS